MPATQNATQNNQVVSRVFFIPYILRSPRWTTVALFILPTTSSDFALTFLFYSFESMTAVVAVYGTVVLYLLYAMPGPTNCRVESRL